MAGRWSGGIVALALLATPAHATQICAWMTEKVDEEMTHSFELWLEADGEAFIYYMIKGEGIVGDGSRSHSPGSGTFVLHAKKPDKPWGFGATLYAPGKIDFIAEIHAVPDDIFDEKEPPLLAAFAFKRDVPEDEAKPPAGFGARQCAVVTIPEPKRPKL